MVKEDDKTCENTGDQDGLSGDETFINHMNEYERKYFIKFALLKQTKKSAIMFYSTWKLVFNDDF